MGSRENFIIFISNIGGNYAVALQNGETVGFFLPSPNNFLTKFLTLRGINCNYRFFPGADTFSRYAAVCRFSDIYRGHTSGGEQRPDILHRLLTLGRELAEQLSVGRRPELAGDEQ